MSYLDKLFTQSAVELTLRPDVLTGNATIEPGFMYVVHRGASPIVLTMKAQPLVERAGKRIAIKVKDFSEIMPPDLTVAAPSGTIENDAGQHTSSAVFTQITGLYREWVCSDTGAWFLVTPPGAGGAYGAADSLLFSTGDAIPLVTRPTAGQVLKYNGTALEGANFPADAGDPWTDFYRRKPSSPHAWDEEFTASSLAGAWNIVCPLGTPRVPVGLVNEGGVSGSSDLRLTSNYRGTYLGWQGGAGGIWRSLPSVPSAFQVRFAVQAGLSSAIGTQALLYIGRLQSGVPAISTSGDGSSGNDWIRAGWTNNGPGIVRWSTSARMGGMSYDGPTGPDMDVRSVQDCEFIVCFENTGSAVIVEWFVRSGPSSPYLHYTMSHNGLASGSDWYAHIVNSAQFNRRSGLSGDLNAVTAWDYLRFRDDKDVDAYL